MKKTVMVCSCISILSLLMSGYIISNKNLETQTKNKALKGSEVMSEETIEKGNSKISQEYAKKIMDSDVEFILLDVRTQSEYDEKHLAGSILIPDFELESRALLEMPDKDALILIYCRSGNRSGKSLDVLENLGYTNLKDFGGLNSWIYEVEK